MATKSKKVSVSKTELEETAVGVEALAESRMEDGLIDVSAGAQTLVEAKKVREVARAAQTIGAVAVTHGLDQMAVAEKLGKLSDVVAAAGELDVAEGIEALVTSEDIQIQSAVVSAFSMAALAPRDGACRGGRATARGCRHRGCAGDARAGSFPGG